MSVKLCDATPKTFGSRSDSNNVAPSVIVTVPVECNLSAVKAVLLISIVSLLPACNVTAPTVNCPMPPLTALSPGAITYLRASDVDPSVKVLKVDGKAPGEAGYPLKIK